METTNILARSLTTSLKKKSFHPFIQLHTPTDPQSATCRMFYEWHHERGLLCQRLHPQDHLLICPWLCGHVLKSIYGLLLDPVIERTFTTHEKSLIILLISPSHVCLLALVSSNPTTSPTNNRCLKLQRFDSNMKFVA